MEMWTKEEIKITKKMELRAKRLRMIREPFELRTCTIDYKMLFQLINAFMLLGMFYNLLQGVLDLEFAFKFYIGLWLFIGLIMPTLNILIYLRTKFFYRIGLKRRYKNSKLEPISYFIKSAKSKLKRSSQYVFQDKKITKWVEELEEIQKEKNA